jgi:hypothetical protein
MSHPSARTGDRKFKLRNTVCRALSGAAGLALTLPEPSLAQAQKQEDMIRETKQLVPSQGARGHNTVVRHGATFSSQAGTDPFNFDNIAQRRNLDNRGKEVAKALGDTG